MNTKGIKFLAVLAVLAMAFAAFAVIAPAEENDAVDTATTVLTDGKLISGPGDNAGKFYTSESITITVTDETDEELKVYVYNGATVTVKFGAGNIANLHLYEVNKKATISADGKTATFADLAGVTDDNTEFTVDQAQSGSIEYNAKTPDLVSDTKVYTTVSGKITSEGALAVTATAGVAVVSGSSFTAAVGVIANLVYDMLYTDNEATDVLTYYRGTVPDVIKLESSEAKGNDTLVATAGKATVTDGTNTVNLVVKYDEGKSVTLTNNYNAGAPFFGVHGNLYKGGELAVVEGFIKVDDAGGLNVYVNQADGAVATAPTSYVDGAVLAATDLGEVASKYAPYANNVIIAALPQQDDGVPAKCFTKIIGKYTILNKNEKFLDDFTVAQYATLTIPEKYSLSIGNKTDDVDDAVTLTIAAGGTMDVWGSIKGVSHKHDGNDVIPVIDADGTLKIRKGASITGMLFTDSTGSIQELPNKKEYNKQSVSIDSTQSIDILSLGGDLTIPKGVTVTVTEMLDLDGHTLSVAGELIIAENATIAGFLNGGLGAANVQGTIVLNSSTTYGKITINGIAGKDVPVKIHDQVMIGVKGISISANKTATTVSGTLKATETMMSPAILLNKATIGNMEIPADVYVSVADDSYLEGILTVKGTLSIEDTKNLIMKDGSALEMTGKLLTNASGMVQAEVTAIGADLVVGDTDNEPVATDIIKLTRGTAAGAPFDITGFTIAVASTEYLTEDAEMYYQRAYIYGSLVTTPAVSATDVTANATIDLQSPVFVAWGTELNEGKAYALVVPDADKELVVEGVYVSVRDTNALDYVGAYYSTGKDETQKYFITDMVSGMAAVASANDKTVDIKTLDGYKVYLLESMTFTNEQIIKSTAGTGSLYIDEGVVLTIESGAVFYDEIIKKIDGKLIVMKGGSCDPDAGLYDVTSENAAGDVTYCGFQTALDDSQEGDTITVTGTIGSAGEPLTSLTIPTKRTVEIDGTIYISKALNITNDAAFNINGKLYFGTPTTKSSKITVSGTMDISTANTVELKGYDGAGDDYDMQIVSTGKFIYKDAKLATSDNYIMIGAVYKDGTNNVLTSVANAIENGAKAVSISEDYSDSTPIVLDGATITVEAGVKVVLGQVDATGGSIVSEGTLSATINGTAGIDGTATIVVSEFTGTINNKAKSDIYTMDIAAMADGSMTISSGVVAVSADEIVIGANKTFTLNAGAELYSETIVDFKGAGNKTFAGDITVYDGDFKVTAGNKVVFSGDIMIADIATLQTIAATFSGDVYVKGTLNLNGDTIVTGNIAVDDSEGSVARLNVNADLILGTDPYTAGAATIIGDKVELAGGSYIAVFAGSSISEKLIVDKELKFTTFYLNGVEYLTAYTLPANDIVAISDVPGDDAVIFKAVKIQGYNMTTMTDATKWLNDNGLPLAADAKVGDSLKMTYEGVAYNAKILVSSVTGVSVFVDGVRYDSGTTINNVKVGTHTLSVTINPGYKGTAAATFAGKSVTSSFEVTSDMTGADPAAVVLSVTGDITIDPGVSPEPTPAEKEAFGITEILLVVLVILIAVMVIIVLLRMNRS